MKKIIALLMGSVGLFLLFASYKEVNKQKVVVQPVQKTDQACTEITDKDLLRVLNEIRTEHGVKPFVLSGELDTIANNRALEMNGQEDNHAGFQKFKGAVHPIYTNFSNLGENIQQWNGCHSVDNIVRGFENSAPHWKAILNPEYDAVGVSYYKNVTEIIFGNYR